MIPVLKRFYLATFSTVSIVHNASLLLVMISIFTACKDDDADIKTSTQFATVSAAPLTSTLSEAEKVALNNACQNWYDSSLKPNAFNGGMLVAKGNEIIFEKYSSTGTDSVDYQSPFHIASVSKTFTAMAILKLKEEGKINLDDLFSHYFPSFNYPGVTIRCLLNHRSGLPNYLYFMEDLKWDQTKPLHNNDILNALINSKARLKDISKPNTHFTYCNTNYALLALLIEKISGLSYPLYIQQQIFTPFQMNSSFVFTPADSNNITENYDWKGKPISNNYLDFVYGDKNIYSTPRDLLNWHIALSSHQFINEASLQESYQPYSNEKPGIKNYGLGWRMNIYPNGKKVTFHNGWWHGNNAVFIRLLDEDACIIVLGNRYNRNIYKAYHLINHFGNYFNKPADILE